MGAKIRQPRSLTDKDEHRIAGSNIPAVLRVGITPHSYKGYDSKVNRAETRSRGICPVIPVKTTAKERPAFFPKALYRTRARIEQCVGKLKRFKRMALRCEKTAQNYGSIVAFGLTMILIKSVQYKPLSQRE